MIKVLVTGASGFVGSRFVHAMKDRYRLLAPSHADFDITSETSMERFMKTNRPQVILHLAAISNTGYCEEHPEESYLVNVHGVVNLAETASKYGSKLIFFSSDQIYNGNEEKGLLSEEMDTAPENHYGRHKKMAEEEVLKLSPDSVALRASWMYDSLREGMPIHGNFVRNIAKALKENSTLEFATREYRGITWIKEVIRNLPYAFSLPGGIYNFGAENTLNTYETALEYVDILKGDKSLILPDHERFPLHVRNISMSMQKAEEASGGAIRFSNTVDGLKKYAESQRFP